VAAERWFPDHHRYRPAEVAELVAAAERAGLTAVTTAKDAVKLGGDGSAWVVEVEVVPLAGSWDELWAACPELLE
jgi:tetraacyldisaccharide 4'-kinase